MREASRYAVMVAGLALMVFFVVLFGAQLGQPSPDDLLCPAFGPVPAPPAPAPLPYQPHA